MKSSKITSLNPYVTSINQKYVTVHQYNDLKDDFDAARPSDTELAADTISEVTSGSGVTIDGVLAIDSTIIAKKVVEEGLSQTLTAADSGKVFFINSDTTAADYVLPAPSAGLTFKWVWVNDCNNAMTITTADTTDTTGDMFKGGLLICSAAAVNNIEEAGANISKLTFDDNVANQAAGTGTWVEITCTEDPTWFVSGVVNSTTDADSTGSHFSNA
jgi:hypothetical protein